MTKKERIKQELAENARIAEARRKSYQGNAGVREVPGRVTPSVPKSEKPCGERVIEDCGDGYGGQSVESLLTENDRLKKENAECNLRWTGVAEGLRVERDAVVRDIQTLRGRLDGLKSDLVRSGAHISSLHDNIRFRDGVISDLRAQLTAKDSGEPCISVPQTEGGPAGYVVEMATALTKYMTTYGYESIGGVLLRSSFKPNKELSEELQRSENLRREALIEVQDLLKGKKAVGSEVARLSNNLAVVRKEKFEQMEEVKRSEDLRYGLSLKNVDLGNELDRLKAELAKVNLDWRKGDSEWREISRVEAADRITAREAVGKAVGPEEGQKKNPPTSKGYDSEQSFPPDEAFMLQNACAKLCELRGLNPREDVRVRDDEKLIGTKEVLRWTLFIEEVVTFHRIQTALSEAKKGI